jgi:hypothetical protein
VKTFPLVMLFALLPLARDRREAATLLVVAVGLPVAAMAPWIVAEPDATLAALRYQGVPGWGGLSLLVQPDLAQGHLSTGDVSENALTRVLTESPFMVTAVPLAAVAVYLVRRRLPPATAVLLVWLTVNVFAVSFTPRYLLWSLPFMLMAGHLREAALLQAMGFSAAVIVHSRPWESDAIVALYVALMLGVLAICAAWLVALLRRGRRAPAPAGA